jgi:SAM-dependent methyltransferase
VSRYIALAPPGARALDLAAGHGRHARLMAQAGFVVDAFDRDPAALAALAAIPGVTAHEADLEKGPWPCERATYGLVVVTNYLWRPRMADLVACLAPGGVLIHETFGLGNERFGKPSNPKFLLAPGELLEAARVAGLRVVAFESGEVEAPRPAVVERICACRLAPDAPPVRLVAGPRGGSVTS